MLKGFFTKKKFLFLSVVIIGFIIGTFFDFEISSALYHKNNFFGLFFAAYGQLPFNLGFAISGAIMFLISLKTNKKIWIIWGILLNLLSLVLCTISPLLYIKNFTWGLSLIISFILIIICDYLIYLYLKDVEVKRLIKYLKFLLLVLILQMMAINLIKLWWGRPRMRMIVTREDAYFVPWYILDNGLKDNLLQQGVALEELKSFPSGHTSAATCILAYSLLPLVKNSDNKKTANRCLAVSLCYILVVAMSRIVAGAHFVSDVTGGFATCLIIILLIYHQMYEKAN